MIPRLHDPIQEHGVLLYLNESFQGWELEVIPSESCGREHKNSFQKIVLVDVPGGSVWK
jgi:hypothetical protein